LGQSLDLPAKVVPLGDEGPDHLRGAAGPETLDLIAQNIPIPCGLAQDRIKPILSLLESGEEMDIVLVDLIAPCGQFG
jgi:hypothetical protein